MLCRSVASLQLAWNGATEYRLAIGFEEVIAGALGGGFVAAVSPLVAQTKERRDVRAEALRQLAVVENARWADDERSREDFRAAVTAFRAAALVAGANRELADRYVDLAAVARVASDGAWEENPDPETGGSISPVLSELVRTAAAINVDHIWHPLRSRPFVRRDAKRIDRAKEEAKVSLKERRHMDWDVGKRML